MKRRQEAELCLQAPEHGVEDPLALLMDGLLVACELQAKQTISVWGFGFVVGRRQVYRARGRGGGFESSLCITCSLKCSPLRVDELLEHICCGTRTDSGGIICVL